MKWVQSLLKFLYKYCFHLLFFLMNIHSIASLEFCEEIYCIQFVTFIHLTFTEHLHDRVILFLPAAHWLWSLICTSENIIGLLTTSYTGCVGYNLILFSSLSVDLLGTRLESEGDSLLQTQACLCYICAGNVEKLVACWTKAQDGSNPLSLQVSIFETKGCFLLSVVVFHSVYILEIDLF